MPTKQVTIIGIMSWPDEPTTPPDPNAPRPSHPIALPGDPWWGTGGKPPTGGGVPTHPIMLPGMPGWGVWPNVPTHPIMLPGMPGWGGGGPVDPGYSPPWAQVPPGGQPPVINPGPHPSHPIMLPGMPGWGLVPIGPGGGGPVDPGYSPPWAQVPPGGGSGSGPVDPGYSPPWAQVPPGTVPPGGGGGWPGGGTPPEKPGFVPIAGGQPGPFLGATWFYSPVYGWLLGVLPPGTQPPTIPPEGTVPPTEIVDPVPPVDPTVPPVDPTVPPPV